MAVVFNASADRLYRNSLPTANTAYTVTMWVRPRAGNPVNPFYFESDAAGTTYALAANSGVLGILNAGGGFIWNVTLGAAMTQDVWYFIAMTINGTTGTLYQGTESSAVTSNSGTIAAQAARYRLNLMGDGYVAGYAPVADAAHIRLWDAVLSAAEIEAERTATTPARTANLTADWRLASAAARATDSSGNGYTLTSAGAGPWEDATGPSVGGVTGTAASTQGAATSAASGVSLVQGAASSTQGAAASSALGGVGAGGAASSLQGAAASVAAGTFQSAIIGSSTSTQGASTSVASGVLVPQGAAISALAGATSASAAIVGAAPITFSTPMPLLSRGRPSYGTGTPSRLFDGGYGYLSETPGPWACSGGSWAAVNLGYTGAASLLVSLSNDNASGGGYVSSSFAAYRVQSSADSTNGVDGTWSTEVTVTGNNSMVREHLISGFSGKSWIKLLVDTCSGGQIDELCIWDASAGTPDTFAFLGDSISDGGVRRFGWSGTDDFLPSFQDRVLLNQPDHYPLQLNVAVTGIGASYWAANIASVLALHPDVKYWCIGIGTNDGSSMPGAISTWRADMTTVINAIVAAGRVPILARAPYTGSASYGGGDFYTSGLAYLNANGVDYLVSTLGVRAGPDFWQLFYDGRTAYAVTSDPHPNNAGYRAWMQAWADNLGDSGAVGGACRSDLAGATSVAAGTAAAAPPPVGTSVGTQSNALSTSIGLLVPVGTSTVAQDAATSTTMGALPVYGEAASTQGNVTGTAIGYLTTHGAAASTQGNATSVAVGVFIAAISGTSVVSQSAALSAAAGIYGLLSTRYAKMGTVATASVVADIATVS